MRRKRGKKKPFLRVRIAKQVMFQLTCGRVFIDDVPMSCGNKSCPKCRWLLLGYEVVMANGDRYFCAKPKSERPEMVEFVPEGQEIDTLGLKRDGHKVIPARKASGYQWSAEIDGVKESIGSDAALKTRFKTMPKHALNLIRCRNLATKRQTQIK